MVRTPRRLERIVRGFASHRRVQMLQILESAQARDVMVLARECGIGLKTASEHTRKLALAGLVYTRSNGRPVMHTLSPRGRRVLMVLRTLQ